MLGTERSITVITVTRSRCDVLRRAIGSVTKQDFNGWLQHLVLVDDCKSTLEYLESSNTLTSTTEWKLVPRDADEVSGPGRLAKLRNIGIRAARSTWVAFLDDDNEFSADHLSTLIACAETIGYPAVYSYRYLLYPNGEPYLEQRYPWRRDPEGGYERYRNLQARGIFTPGSNIMRDQIDPKSHPYPIRTVDTSEWLIKCSLLLDIPFCESYSYTDWLNKNTEDKKLNEALIDHEVPIASSGKPTLKYYLGGYSNSFDYCDPSHRWVSPDGSMSKLG